MEETGPSPRGGWRRGGRGGQIIAEMFALKGTAVAVMDIKPPSMEGNYSIEYYECDVSDADAVHHTAQKIT